MGCRGLSPLPGLGAEPQNPPRRSATRVRDAPAQKGWRCVCLQLPRERRKMMGCRGQVPCRGLGRSPKNPAPQRRPREERASPSGLALRLPATAPGAAKNDGVQGTSPLPGLGAEPQNPAPQRRPREERASPKGLAQRLSATAPGAGTNLCKSAQPSLAQRIQASRSPTIAKFQRYA